MSLVEVQGLTVDYWQQGRWSTVVSDLNLHVDAGETFGLVGESGCGKSTTANAMLGFRPRGARYRKGSVWFEGRDLLKLPASELRKLRGAKIAWVPQNPTTALSPGMRVGDQIVETLLVHRSCTDVRMARARAAELLGLVSLKDPQGTARKYPHQLSGGQQQRVVIAMGLACDPRLILLDEPTTGLDVTTQAQILDLLGDLRARYGLAMFYVTHNLGVVAQICHRIGVMYAGRLMEVAPKREMFRQPRHPYTQGLIASVPRLGAPSRHQSVLLKGLLQRGELPPGCPFAPRCEYADARCFAEPPPLLPAEAGGQASGSGHQVACWRWQEVPSLNERLAASARPEDSLDEAALAGQPSLLRVEGMSAGYSERRGPLHMFRGRKVIVEDIDLDVRPGETFALVGESGSGKTTVARAVTGLLPFVTGDVKYGDRFDLTAPANRRPKQVLRAVQLVFQNPDASLNPRQRVSQIVGRPVSMFFKVSGAERQRRVDRLLADVRLDASYRDRYPDELSGGERQRVAIARALASDPKLVSCDEVLSALDVSVQANILELLVELQDERHLAYLFISHDLAVVRSLAHRVGVMYWGALCEVGGVEEVFGPPYHPYTYLLLSAVPEADPDQAMPDVRRDVGLLTEEARPACPFATRCPVRVGAICDEVPPPWIQISPTHRIRCHASLDVLKKQVLGENTPV